MTTCWYKFTTYLANVADPAHPGRFLVFRIAPDSIFVDFDTVWTFEIMGKPKENLGLCIIFIFSAKSLPNQTKVAMGRARTFKMEAQGTQNCPQRDHNDSWELHDEAQYC